MEGGHHLLDVQLNLLFNISPHTSEERYELIWKCLCRLLILTVLNTHWFIRLEVSSCLHEDFPSDFSEHKDHVVDLDKTFSELVLQYFVEVCFLEIRVLRLGHEVQSMIPVQMVHFHEVFSENCVLLNMMDQVNLEMSGQEFLLQYGDLHHEMHHLELS